MRRIQCDECGAKFKANPKRSVALSTRDLKEFKKRGHDRVTKAVACPGCTALTPLPESR